MYILKNAFVSIWRNKSRNILMGIIIIVIACASTIALAISSSANHLISSYKDSYEITGTLGFNRDKTMQSIKPGEGGTFEFETLSVEEVKKYAESEYVKDFYYTLSIGMNSNKLTAVDSSSTSDFGGRKFQSMNSTAASFTLQGYNSKSAMEEFLSGTYKITDGEVFSDFTGNDCVINEELAARNNITVGDTITFVNPNDSSKTIELKVTGIYSDQDDSNDSSMNPFSMSSNLIITNTSVIESVLKKDNTLNVSVNPTYVLNGQEDIEPFQKELTKKGLSDTFIFNSNLEEAEQATSSISNLKTFAITFLIITLIIGAVVLFVLNLINVRERKYEIGVLRTIGMKKSLVASQFLCELFMVSLISLVIGMGIGSCLSVPTANKLLEHEINTSQESKNKVNENFGGSSGAHGSISMNAEKGSNRVHGIANVEQVRSIHAVVNWQVVMKLLGIGILLTTISSCAAIISIMRFSPLTILKERS